MTKKEIRRTEEYKNLKCERKWKLGRNKLIEKLDAVYVNTASELKEVREYLGEKLDEIHITDIILDYKKSLDFQLEKEMRYSYIINKYNNDWYLISRYKLSESFIREYQDKVDWNIISNSQILSESFIREFQDKVDWYQISQRQKLSISFIREFHDKMILSIKYFYRRKRTILSSRKGSD